MKKNLMIIALTMFVMSLLTGCAAVQTPAGFGLLFTDAKIPSKDSTSDTMAVGMVKVGKAECIGVLGLIVTGDCSLRAAMQNAQITKIHHVDNGVFSILAIFSRYETVVYGE